MTVTTVYTNDGKNVEIMMLRSIFNSICDLIVARDSEFNWKEIICFDTKFYGANHANLVATAIEFFVGGKTTFYMFSENGEQRIEFQNKGYYSNIGA